MISKKEYQQYLKLSRRIRNYIEQKGGNQCGIFYTKDYCNQNPLCFWDSTYNNSIGKCKNKYDNI